MVKNTTGGSKTKGQGRKFTSIVPQNRVRLSEEEEELYAKVLASLGNGMCEVMCVDGKKRLCHIRGKFRGRGKRDNFIGRDSYVLIGKRDWEGDEEKCVKGKIKLPNCDLLEVYTSTDIERIKSLEKIDWSVFVEEKSNVEKMEEIEFKDTVADDDYNRIMEDYNEKESNVIKINNEEINVDDI